MSHSGVEYRPRLNCEVFSFLLLIATVTPFSESVALRPLHLGYHGPPAGTLAKILKSQQSKRVSTAKLKCDFGCFGHA